MENAEVIRVFLKVTSLDGEHDLEVSDTVYPAGAFSSTVDMMKHGAESCTRKLIRLYESHYNS